MLIVAGCHKASSDARVNVPSQVASDTLTDNIIMRPIGTFVSVMIGEGIEVTDVKDRITKDGLMEVQVRGYNHSKLRKLFDYRVEWLDIDGLVVDSVMTKWHTQSAMPKAEFSFKAIGPNKRAEDYRINMRPNKTTQ
jgi:hypothetical protein